MHIMDTSKYITPKLPTTQNILDDICSSGTRHGAEEFKMTNYEGKLHDAYRCYMNFEALKKGLKYQNEMNNTLEDLNTKLLQCIENMKKQQ